MNSLLRHLSVYLSFLPAASYVAQTRTKPHHSCRCSPDESCWPKSPEWSALNDTLNGSLVRTIPIASVCHTNQNFTTHDLQTCASLQELWNLPETHISSSSSVMAPFFANRSCDPFSHAMSCTIGSYVQYAILVRRASDIMAGIAFAKARNIRLVIRNTAHDYLGKSTGSLALAIWTHHLKDIQFLDFKSNYYYGKAVKLGAGVQFSEVYQTAKARGLVVVGGNCLTVGIAGGYSQGGGHGMLASRYGLAADQVLRWDVVTAEGKLLVATPLQNADLYWALCGGGGGTYGVVVSLTVRVYPDKRTSASNFAFTNEGVDQDTYYAAVSAYIKNSLTIADAGSVASFLLTNTSFTVAPITGYGLTKADLDRFVLPTVNVLNQYKMNYSYISEEFPNFVDVYEDLNLEAGVGLFQLGGRLVPRSVITESAKSLVETLRDLNERGAVISGITLNADGKPHLPNAVHPEWRRAGLSIVMGTLWSNTDWNLNLQNQKLMTDVLNPKLDEVLKMAGEPSAGYLNEADFREADWQNVFYGPNYPRLLQIKNKYDPHGIFWARTAVGSEAWSESSGGKLCRVS